MILAPYTYPCKICESTMYLEFYKDDIEWVSVVDGEPSENDQLRLRCEYCDHTFDPMDDPYIKKETNLLKMKITGVLVQSGYYSWSKNGI